MEVSKKGGDANQGGVADQGNHNPAELPTSLKLLTDLGADPAGPAGVVPHQAGIPRELRGAAHTDHATASC